MLIDDRVEQFKHIDARVKLKRSTIGIVAEFTVNFDVRFNCSRCLETYDSTCTSQLHLVYVHGRDPYRDKENVVLRPDDIERVYYTGSLLDMAIGIREAIVLAIPIAPVCKEDCLGLCPVCGKSRNGHSCDCTAEQRGVFTPKVSGKRTPAKKKHRHT